MADSFEDRLAEVWETFVSNTETINRLFRLVEETNSINRDHLGNHFMWAVSDHCNQLYTLTHNGNVKLEKVPLERVLGYMEAVNDDVTSELEDEILEGGF
jgi:hypothetical protein